MSEIKLVVNEIFGSIDGEGKRTGKLTTFIRLAGCNLRCIYCDTGYSLDNNQGNAMTINEIITACKQIGYHNITLTGGEPLIHAGVSDLILKLCAEGFQVNVETNGSIDLQPYIKLRDLHGLDLFFTVDYKCIYSKMNKWMNEQSFLPLVYGKDLVKCVVASEADMIDALAYLDSFKKPFDIWFSPVFGEIEPKGLVEFIKKHNRQDVTVQVQLHKIIWDPKKRGV